MSKVEVDRSGEGEHMRLVVSRGGAVSFVTRESAMGDVCGAFDE